MDTLKRLFRLFGVCAFPEFARFIVEGEGGPGKEEAPENEPPQGKSGEGENEDDVTDYDAEVQKRGAKNIIEENRRRAAELKALRDEFEAFKNQSAKPEKKETPEQGATGKRELPPPLARRIKKWTEEQAENRRIDPEFMNDLAEMILETSVGAIDYHLNNDAGLISKKFSALSKVQKRYANEMLKDSIVEIGKKDDYKFLVSKYKDEIEAEVRKEVDPEYWEDPAIVQRIADSIFVKHHKEFSGGGDDDTGKVKQQKVNETENSTGGKGSAGVSSAELVEYADTYGIDLSNPEAKKAAIKGVLAKKKAMSHME